MDNPRAPFSVFVAKSVILLPFLFLLVFIGFADRKISLPLPGIQPNHEWMEKIEGLILTRLDESFKPLPGTKFISFGELSKEPRLFKPAGRRSPATSTEFKISERTASQVTGFALDLSEADLPAILAMTLKIAPREEDGNKAFFLRGIERCPTFADLLRDSELGSGAVSTFSLAIATCYADQFSGLDLQFDEHTTTVDSDMSATTIFLTDLWDANAVIVSSVVSLKASRAFVNVVYHEHAINVGIPIRAAALPRGWGTREPVLTNTDYVPSE